ncbi:MAG: hypothetical protein E7594_06215 [Ruminococcaceae bacterium]|nr:hypothetical protein [Oscillospiraceae bacterium]
MKRILPCLLLALLLTATLAGCARTTQIDDLSRTSYIKVRAFSNVDRSYTDYVITDYRKVDEICDTLESLSLQKVRITEPLAISYTLSFYDHAHREIDSVRVVFGDYLDYDGDLYLILTTDCEFEAYLDKIVAELPPAEKGE